MWAIVSNVRLGLDRMLISLMLNPFLFVSILPRLIYVLISLRHLYVQDRLRCVCLFVKVHVIIVNVSTLCLFFHIGVIFYFMLIFMLLWLMLWYYFVHIDVYGIVIIVYVINLICVLLCKYLCFGIIFIFNFYLLICFVYWSSQKIAKKREVRSQARNHCFTCFGMNKIFSVDIFLHTCICLNPCSKYVWHVLITKLE